MWWKARKMHSRKTENVRNRHAHRLHPENSVTELWSTPIIGLSLKAKKPLWQLMKARLVTPPTSSGWWCGFSGYEWVSVHGGGRMGSTGPNLHLNLMACLSEAQFYLQTWWSSKIISLFNSNDNVIFSNHKTVTVFIKLLMGLKWLHAPSKPSKYANMCLNKWSQGSPIILIVVCGFPLDPEMQPTNKLVIFAG